MLPRFHIGMSLSPNRGDVFELPEGAARHVQVLRMQPGGLVQLFDGQGVEWRARVLEMGRKKVLVEMDEAVTIDRELPVRVTLALGMPANDRMDTLVEKAAELGVFAIQPLLCERSVLRLDGERAIKKVAHWQAVAVAACEQSGRAVVPQIHELQALPAWLRAQAENLPNKQDASPHRAVLSLRDAKSLRDWLAVSATSDAAPGAQDHYIFLSGPEGGLSPTEEQSALDAGWAAVTLGSRVLRADTAPLAALSVIGALFEPAPTKALGE